jgi:hypothetical protein
MAGGSHDGIIVIQCQVSMAVHTEPNDQGCYRELIREVGGVAYSGLPVCLACRGLSCMKICPVSLSTYNNITLRLTLRP